MTLRLDAAAQFLFSSARLLERHRFAHLFRGGPAEPVLQVLRAYRNPDGGFGHALEPDLRAPASQPVGVQTAMEILHETGARDDPMIGPACDFLSGIAHPDGGVPFALDSAAGYPKGPWWEPADVSSLTQTAANAAALLTLGVSHPWLGGAAAFCWQRIAAFGFSHPHPGLGYDLLFAVRFLDAAPDEARALAALDDLRDPVRTSGLVALEPGTPGDLQSPLGLSPEPGARSRLLFDDATIGRHLDALAAGQRSDGGWTFPWPEWNAAATLEWRGVVTVEALKVLRANGRLSSSVTVTTTRIPDSPDH
ncbi:MAG: hypothetical protein ACRDKW_00990 [Actinomycetota bacterium]